MSCTITIEDLTRRVRSGEVQFLTPESFAQAHKQLDEMEDQVRKRIKSMSEQWDRDIKLDPWNRPDKSDKSDKPAKSAKPAPIKSEIGSIIINRIKIAINRGDLPVIDDLPTVTDRPLTGFTLKGKKSHLAMIRPAYWREVICKDLQMPPDNVVACMQEERRLSINTRRKIGKYGFLRFLRVEVKL